MGDEVRWTSGAMQLLRKRDHYTRDAIERDFLEFVRNPGSDPTPVDQGRVLFVTPVANRRYSVIWKRDEPLHAIIVEAVVPAQFASSRAGNLMQQVRKVVEIESDGDVTL